MKQNYWSRVGVSLCVLVLVLGQTVGTWRWSVLERLEVFLYDLRVNLTLSSNIDERLVIVDIDEKSLKSLGHWPWSRDVLARLIEQLNGRYQVALTGFDVVFAEPDTSSGLPVLERLGQQQLADNRAYQQTLQTLRTQLDYDHRFASALTGKPVVLGYYFSNGEGSHNALNHSGALPTPIFDRPLLEKRQIPFVHMRGFTSNLAPLQRAALSSGYFSFFPDIDGTSRRVPLLVEYEGRYYEALSLAMARALLGNPPLQLGLPAHDSDYQRIEWLGFADIRVPVDTHLQALVPYQGRAYHFPYVSAVDVIQGRVPLARLQGKIVLVGTSAPGLLDLRSAPVDNVYPGVEVHANLVMGILDGTIKHHPAYTVAVEFLTLLGLGLSLAFLLPRLGPIKGTLWIMALGAVVLGVNVWAWQRAHFVLPLANTLFLLVGLYVLNTALGFFIETRTKRQLAQRFGQYIPPELVAEMSQNFSDFSMEGDSREMTVLFSDVRNFTTISEGLSPKQLSRLMNDYMTPMTQIIHQQRGTIDKYIGDAIMAFWGAPLADPTHAEHAVLAALEMQATLTQLRPQFMAQGYPELHIGIGINTGEMRVGNMGSEFRMAYTVMGDAVNLGSRLEGITKEYGVGIIVGENTAKATPNLIYRELDQVRVKGKDHPVAIFEPLGRSGSLNSQQQQELKQFQALLHAYRRQDWAQAEQWAATLVTASPQTKVYKLYLERIAYFKEHTPPADWDGVFVFKTK